MSEFFLKFIEQYGYWLVFFASFVEGESIIISAAIFASQGRLNIYYVTLITFLGTLFADQVFYFIGRYWGKSLFFKFPLIAKKSVPVLEFLRKYNTTFILFFRFIYGIRTLSPIVIGIAGVEVKRFVVLNFVAAIIWTLMCCGAGYWLGDTILTNLKGIGAVVRIVLVIALTLCVLFIMHKGISLYFKNEINK